MKNFYKEKIEKIAMEKIAARAWKKFLPRLSDANYNKLLNAGVYNPDKELKGLNRGTYAILNKYDAKMIKNPNRAGAASAEMVRKGNKMAGRRTSKFEIEAYKSMPKDEMSPFSATLDTKPNEPFKSTGRKNGFTFVPKNWNNASIKANPEQAKITNTKPFSRRDRDGRKWTQALAARHEADEIRYSTINRNKGIGQGASYSSHISPKVLAQESANMGIAPRSMKNNPVKGFRENSGESAVMENISGVPYASSGVYNKKGAKKAENYLINYNKSIGKY